jgi:hypothetical protein
MNSPWVVVTGDGPVVRMHPPRALNLFVAGSHCGCGNAMRALLMDLVGKADGLMRLGRIWVRRANHL